MTNRTLRVLIVLIVLGGTYLRSQNLLEPWVEGHNAWGGAYYGNIARNFLRYGYGQTHFAPVANSGVVPVEEFKYYYHHPPLLVWMVSLSYRVFGVAEWSARLVPLSFSVLLMGLVYRFSRQAFSQSAAIFALIFCAVLPIENYYGAHVDSYGPPSVFFSLLAVYGYFRWLKTRSRFHLMVLLLGVVLGCMTAWFTYFVVPLILAHYHGFRGSGSRSRVLLVLPVAAVAVFLLFLVHREIAVVDAKGEVYGTLLEKLRIRTSFPRVGPTGEEWGKLGLALHLARDLVRMYYPPILVLTAVWAGMFARDWIRHRLQDGDWCILILLGYGLLNALAFPSALPGHDYLSRCYVPGVCMASALAFMRTTDAMGRRFGRTVGTGAAVALLAGVMGPSLYRSHRLRWGDDVQWGRNLERWAELVRASTDPRATVLVPDAEDRVFQYYVDRVMRFRVESPERIREAQAEHARRRRGNLVYVCFNRSATKHADVLAYLDGKHQRHEEGGLILYHLDSAPDARARSSHDRGPVQ